MISEEWYLSIVCPIHKKGDVMVCSNYRGISLLCIAYKRFSNILLDRLYPCVEDIIGDCQCGFRQGRSTYNHIFSIRQILEKCNEFQIETHHLLIDFRSAYDTIGRDNLYRAMEDMDILRKLITMVRATMRKTQCKSKFRICSPAPL
jgi:hypothetical protein